MKDQVRLTPQQREFLEERGLSAAFMKEVAQRRGKTRTPLHKVAFANQGILAGSNDNTAYSYLANQNNMINNLANNMDQGLTNTFDTAASQDDILNAANANMRSRNQGVGQNSVGYTNMDDMAKAVESQQKALLEQYKQAGIDPSQLGQAAFENQFQSGTTTAIPGVDPGDGTVFYPPPVTNDPVEPQPVQQPQYDYSVTRPYEQVGVPNVQVGQDYSNYQTTNAPGSFNANAYQAYLSDKYDLTTKQTAANDAQKRIMMEVTGASTPEAAAEILNKTDEDSVALRQQFTSQMQATPEYTALVEADRQRSEEAKANPEYTAFVQQQMSQAQMADQTRQGAANLASAAMSDRESLVRQQDVARLDPYTQGTTIAAGTGQVGEMDDLTATTATGTTTNVPIAGTATTYDATKGTAGVKSELATIDAATGTMSTGAQVDAQKGELSPEAKAKAATMDPNRVEKVVSGDRVIDSKEIAQAQGLDEEAIAAKVANADVPENIQTAKTSVQLDEIPDPAQIKESEMAQAEIMTSEGLVDDAKAAIDKLNKFSVDDQTLAEFKEGKIDARDTVSGQLSILMSSFDDGKTPDWAKGAIKAATAAMASRGLGGSSMAAAAITSAIMERAIPLAESDAAAFRDMNMNNLGRQQQVSLANAAAQQGVDLANLNSEQVLALQNSQNAFSLQSQNLSNMQSTMLSNAQLKASLQGQNLSNQQQANIVEAARYAEVNNLNLNNTQQGLMQDNLNSLQVNLANLSSNQQAYIANANLEAALQGKRIDNKQQTAIANAAKYFEAGNVTFSAEQQSALHNSNLMSTIGLSELNAEQQAVLQNATAVASMDMTNLNNRQQAAVENAKAFLNLDLANLNNQQQTALFKGQSVVQSLFTDQAADNAAKQFNASSENQVDQFFSNLISTVQMANTAQSNSMSQFNAGQTNTIASLVANIENARDQFNASNSLQIAQGNANWRQNVATINTAADNEAYAQFAKDLNSLTDGAIDEIWQRERDIMSFSFDFAQNAMDRTLNLLLADKNLESVRQQIAASDNAAEDEMLWTIGLELLKNW